LLAGEIEADLKLEILRSTQGLGVVLQDAQRSTDNDISEAIGPVG
jgi:hypothetical protein